MLRRAASCSAVRVCSSGLELTGDHISPISRLHFSNRDLRRFSLQSCNAVFKRFFCRQNTQCGDQKGDLLPDWRPTVQHGD
jgi:hypothetical protein